ncbi:hypothetical protein FGL01_28040 [Flavobacterium glycines]|uniref:RDD domain-containing protein n=1 Tax=Flavobacterium glycines TaxID=551990 RepID=A0A511CHE3_9FLAO|nr:hypothetical protein FGL01_28040 [Flavobacterium glycines]
MILISKIVFVPIWIYSSYLTSEFRSLHPEFNTNFNWIHSVLYYIFQIFIIVISFRILKYLSSDKELDFSEKVYGEHISKEYTVATKSQRFLNYLVDTLVWIIVYSSIFSTVNSLVFMQKQIDSSLIENNTMANQFVGDSSNNNFIALLYLLLFRFIYYIFFEFVFKASPAKFLTETRVMDYSGEPTNFKEIFLKTTFRNIPFNTITFLFGYNLQDNWSATEVFKEKRVGVSGNKYLGYFFIIAGSFFLVYLGVRFYEKKHEENFQVQLLEEKIKHNKKALSELEIGDIIIIHHYDSNDYGQYILKINRIIGEKVYFNMIDSNDYNYPEDELIIVNKDKYFLNELETFSVNKKNLSKAIISVDEMKMNENHEVVNPEGFGFKLLNDKKNYFIINVLALRKPILKIEKARWSETNNVVKELNFSISNLGISSKLIAIKSNQDDVLWGLESSTILPIQIPNKKNDSNSYVLNLKGKGDNLNNSDFTISVQDSLGKIYDYQILANNVNPEIIIKSL